MNAPAKKCVVGVGVGAWYPFGLERLAKSLQEHHFTGEVLHWSSSYPPNSVPHSQIPYGFKLHAIAEAKNRGFDQVLWLDASMFAVKPIEPLFEIVDEQGYFLSESGWFVGQWTTDAALEKMGIDREKALTIQMAISGCVAFDFRNEKATALYEAWMGHACDGVSFVGPWRNVGGAMSSDPRVLGHRHDMPSLGYHAWKMGLTLTEGETIMQYYKPVLKEKTVLACRGMY